MVVHQELVDDVYLPIDLPNVEIDSGARSQGSINAAQSPTGPLRPEQSVHLI